MPSLDDLRQRLVSSGLMAAEDIDRRLAKWRSEATVLTDDREFLGQLVQEQVLTDFQADSIAAGHPGPFLLGPYEVREHVAAGRFGHTFRAVHKQFNQPVSLKVFPAEIAGDPDKLAHMQREVRVGVQLDHPYLLRTFHAGRVGPVHYVAFEDLEGETLAARIAREGRVPYPEACRLARQAALALEYLHNAEIVHADIRPANLWITARGQLKLLEFGAARDALEFLDQPEESRAKSGGQTECSPNAAPEQVASDARPDARGDIYALGCTLYHTLTGRPPFKATTRAELAKAHAGPPSQVVSWLAPAVPGGLSEVVAVAMARDPAGRYQTAAELDWALGPFAGEGSIGSAVDNPTWSEDFLAWTQSAGLASEPGETATVSQEFNEFLNWLTEKKPEGKTATAS